MVRVMWRYGLAVVAVGAALLITTTLEKYTDITPLFYAAVVVSAWFGGRGPGLLAVVLSALAIDYFLGGTVVHALGSDKSKSAFWSCSEFWRY